MWRFQERASAMAECLHLPCTEPNLSQTVEIPTIQPITKVSSMATADASLAQAPAAFKVIQAATTVTILQVSILAVMLMRSKLTAVLLGPEGVGVVGTLDQLVQFVAQVSAFSLIAAPS